MFKRHREENDQHNAQPERGHREAEEAEGGQGIVEPRILAHGRDDADGKSDQQADDDRGAHQEHRVGQAALDQFQGRVAVGDGHRHAPVAGQEARPAQPEAADADVYWVVFRAGLGGVEQPDEIALVPGLVPAHQAFEPLDIGHRVGLAAVRIGVQQAAEGATRDLAQQKIEDDRGDPENDKALDRPSDHIRRHASLLRCRGAPPNLGVLWYTNRHPRQRFIGSLGRPHQIHRANWPSVGSLSPVCYSKVGAASACVC